MANNTETCYPPYGGKEPYIHLCFSDRDERKIRPLLRRLLLKGCRVWYCVGQTRNRATQLDRNEHMLGAGLTVLYLTEAARADTELKNRLLVCQKARQPILVLNTDGGDSGLSLGLTGEASANLLEGHASDAVDAILHGRGFSQLFLGDPLPVYDRLWLRRINRFLLLLALLLAVGAGVYVYLHPPVFPSDPAERAEVIEATPEPRDTALIEDEALQASARAAIGGGLLTEESLSTIETLHLSQLPQDAEELALFPHLTTLVLSQEAAQAAPQQPELYERYTLIVAGGEGR